VSDDSKILRNSCIVGCVGCAGLVVLAVAVVAGLFFWSRREVAPETQEFLDAVEAGRYEEAYRVMSEEWRARNSLAAFTEEWRGRAERLGPRLSLAAHGFGFNVGDGSTTARVRYDARYERGRVHIEFELERREGEWIPTDVRFTEILEPEEPPGPEQPDEVADTEALR